MGLRFVAIDEEKLRKEGEARLREKMLLQAAWLPKEERRIVFNFLRSFIPKPELTIGQKIIEDVRKAMKNK